MKNFTDGLILSEAFVDESMITGESRAVNKKTNDLVYGGSSIKTNHLR
jgi:Cu2+-exporting ATPase